MGTNHNTPGEVRLHSELEPPESPDSSAKKQRTLESEELSEQEDSVDAIPQPEWLEEASRLVVGVNHMNSVDAPKMPFVNREITISDQVSVFMHNLYTVQFRQNKTRGATYCSIADIMYGSGKTTFGEKVLPTARAAVQAWLQLAESVSFDSSKLSAEDQEIIKDNLFNQRTGRAISRGHALSLAAIGFLFSMSERCINEIRSAKLTFGEDHTASEADAPPADAPSARENHRRRLLVIGMRIIQQASSRSSRLDGKELTRFHSWWPLTLYRLLHSNIKYIEMDMFEFDVAQGRVAQIVRDTIEEVKGTPHRSVLFHFDESNDERILRQVWTQMIGVRRTHANPEGSVQNGKDVLVEFMFTGRQTLFDHVGQGNYLSPSKVHWILFSSLQVDDVEEIIERIPRVKTALSQCFDDSGVESPTDRARLIRSIATEITVASGGIPRLIEYCLGATTELIEEMLKGTTKLTLKSESDVHILVHQVLYKYFERSLEAERVVFPKGAEDLGIDNSDMLLIISQLLSRNDPLDISNPGKELQFNLSNGRHYTIKISTLMSRLPIYFSKHEPKKSTPFTLISIVPSSFIMRKMFDDRAVQEAAARRV